MNMATEDGDQFTNIEEFLAGTNPRDPNSRLLMRAEKQTGGLLRLVWEAVPGREYFVQSGSQAFGDFRDLDSAPITAATTDLIYECRPEESATRFYRLRLAE
jgi:hypothetical protein